MSNDPTTPTARGVDPRRRTLLVAGAAAPWAGVVAACGGGAPSAEQPDVPQSAEEDAADGSGADPGGTPVAQVSDVPVGGASFVDDGGTSVVLTQPEAGQVRAFDTTCPHQGCAVRDVENGQLVCPCHGSRFDLASGDVVQGPATRGLTPRAVTVVDDGIVLEGGR